MSKKSKRSESFRPIFEFLKVNNVEPFIIEAARFELAGYSTNKIDFESTKDYLEQFTCLPIRREDIDTAMELSSMYKCKNPSISAKQISFADCLHAAQLIRYKEKAFIVTTDINDYPAFLFDMYEHVAIEELDGRISFVGLKTFNSQKWSGLQKTFAKSGRRSSI